MPDAVLLTVDGLHEPVIPLSDGLYKAGTADPEQIVNDGPNAKVGVITGFTLTVRVKPTAHCDPLGTKV